jgi:hypothetical protein
MAHPAQQLLVPPPEVGGQKAPPPTHTHHTHHHTTPSTPSLPIAAGVYTRNRAFRLYLSAKFGRAAHLTATGRFASRGLPPISRATFRASLITHCPGLLGQGQGQGQGQPGSAAVQGRSKAATWASAAAAGMLQRDVAAAQPAAGGQQQQQQQGAGEGAAAGADGGGPPGAAAEQQQQPVAFRWDPATATRFQDVLLLRMFQDQDQQKHQGVASLEQLRGSGSAAARGRGQQPGQQGGGTGAAAAAAGGAGAAMGAPCYGASPYPCLERFIESVCCRGGVQGQVRSWLAYEAAAGGGGGAG